MISFMDVGTQFNLHGEPWKVRKVISPIEVEMSHMISGTTAVYDRKRYMADFISESLVLPTPQLGKDDTEVWLMSDWPPEAQKKIKYRLKWVQGIDKYNVPKSKPKLLPFIKSYSQEIDDIKPPSYKTISNWHTTWVKANRHYSVLISGDDIRKRSPRVQKDLNKLYLEGIETVYFAGPETNATDVKVWVEGKVESDRYSHISQEKVSLSTIERRIKDLDEFERVARKFGRTVALNLFNSRKKVTVPSRVLQAVEIDETWADIFVVAEDGTPLGRPNIIFVVDVYSRMILAVNISFMTPSSSTVLHAIKQAILPKNTILDQLTYVKEDWDVYGIPDAIKTDNIQHYLSDDFIAGLGELGIDHIKCPVGRPNFKGIVERLFGKVSRKILAKSPGYAKPLKQRFTELDLDPEKTAVFTIDEVRELVYKYFIDIYCHDYQHALEGTPIELWEDSFKDFGVRMDQPLRKIELALRNTGEASIQNGGLTFERIEYDDKGGELQRLRQRLKQKRLNMKGQNPKVVFKYSVDDLGLIYVKDPETKQYLRIPAVDQQYASGLTYHQHKEIRSILNSKKTQVVTRPKLRKAKAELLDMCLGLISQHNPLIPRKKVAKLTETQFGSVDDAALAILDEFDSDNIPTTKSPLPLTSGSDLIKDDFFTDDFELGDDDV